MGVADQYPVFSDVHMLLGGFFSDQKWGTIHLGKLLEKWMYLFDASQIIVRFSFTLRAGVMFS